MDRRAFLASLAALGVQGALGSTNAASLESMAAAKGSKRRKTGKFDEDLVVFISDLHTNPKGYSPDKLRRVLADILKLRPLPLNVIALGDLAYLTGKPEEYALLKEIIVPLEASGIHFTMAMGNHDRRENFAAAFPQYAAKSLMPDRFVFKVETPRADFIILDSLQQGDDTTKWITPGKLNDAQKEWLEKTVKNYTKPVFVTAHHNIGETGLQKILTSSPTCSGYIHGHDHVWRPGWARKNWSEHDILRTLCLPSTGLWGDIGYTLFRMDEVGATANIKEYEFYFPTPVKDGEKVPEQWKVLAEEHNDAVCRFIYRNV
ncbi:MAG: metallophosphoesterase [Bacteroidaceae bacterium]|nr:metallophosphoesterase [Bacteroidaceae bacterium]